MPLSGKLNPTHVEELVRRNPDLLPDLEAQVELQRLKNHPAYYRQRRREALEKARQEKGQKNLANPAMGLGDMEIYTAGVELGALYAKAGARRFTQWAGQMIDLDEGVRPYLKAIYNGMRDLPDMAEYRKEMDDAATVEKADVNLLGAPPAEQPPTETAPPK